ncbi:MAG: hypothetical protein BECKG1743D_GA0114223_107512, partial [Candidatus Kentron sp. G]
MFSVSSVDTLSSSYYYPSISCFLCTFSVRSLCPEGAAYSSPGVTARVISGVASHIQVEETEALHVSRIALMVRGYLRSECVK